MIEGWAVTNTVPEEWRDVVISVSSLGNLKINGAPIEQKTHSNGYSGITKWGGFINTHRIVCETFHGEKPNHAHVVRHLDGVKSNNSSENLRWGTFQENVIDTVLCGNSPNTRLSETDVISIRNEYKYTTATTIELARKYGINSCAIGNIVSGKSFNYYGGPLSQPSKHKKGRVGEAHPGSKLTAALVEEMRRLNIEEGVSLSALTKKFGVCQAVVLRIITGATWKHAPGPIRAKRENIKFPEHTVLEIRRLYANGVLSQHEIAEMFGCGHTAIGAIVTGKTYKKYGGPITHRGERYRPPNRHNGENECKSTKHPASPKAKTARRTGTRSDSRSSSVTTRASRP